MRPLQVALVHRDSPRCGEARAVGWWSYPVAEFEWTHFPMPKHFTLDRGAFLDYDLIVYEDGKLQGTFSGDGPPIAYVIVDSTLSDDHYRVRRDQARQCDLLLVDWDRLARFEGLGAPVRRFSYCVNDRLMRDHGQPKEYDVGSFQSGTPERRALEDLLRAWCSSGGHRFEAGRHVGPDYAIMMNRSKVVLNLGRNRQTRNHRVFDAMACRACLLTDPLPPVSDEPREAGVHYVEWEEGEQLAPLLQGLLEGGWEDVAAEGFMLAHQHHTWAVRATQLREILAQELGL